MATKFQVKVNYEKFLLLCDKHFDVQCPSDDLTNVTNHGDIKMHNILYSRYE